MTNPNEAAIRALANTVQSNIKMPDRPIHPGYGFNYVAVLMGPDIAPVAETFSMHTKLYKSKDVEGFEKRLLTRGTEQEFKYVELTVGDLADLLNPSETPYYSREAITRNHDCSTVTVKGSAIRYMTLNGKAWNTLSDDYQILITESSQWVDDTVDKEYLRDLHQWASDVAAFSGDNARKAEELKKLLDQYK